MSDVIRVSQTRPGSSGDVWRRLLTVRCESLPLHELQPYGTFRLEFVADTGTAVTGPLRLSDPALEWLQSAVFPPTT